MKQLIRKFLMSVNRDLYFRIIDRKNIKAFEKEGRLDFEFNADVYDLPFLTNEFPETEQPIRNAPEKIYIFWTGTNEMPPHRKKGLQSLIEKSETIYRLAGRYFPPTDFKIQVISFTRQFYNLLQINNAV